MQWLLRQEKAVFEWKALGKIAVFVLAAFPLQNETRRFEGSVGDSLASGRTFWGLCSWKSPSRSGSVQGVEARKLNAARTRRWRPTFSAGDPQAEFGQEMWLDVGLALLPPHVSHCYRAQARAEPSVV